MTASSEHEDTHNQHLHDITEFYASTEKDAVCLLLYSLNHLL